MGSQLDGDLQHVLAEHRHPRRAVRLLKTAAGRKRRTAVEDADVVQSEKPALEQILAESVFAIHPPTEIQHQLGERPLEKIEIAFSIQGLLGAVQEDCGPGVNRRIDVAEVPLVGRDLTGGMEEESPAASDRAAALAKSGSTVESAMAWNARSQAAYQGYSHLSGIEMMC